MKLVYVRPNEKGSSAIERVERALGEHLPRGVKFIGNKEEADLIVLHVIGRHDAVLREAEQIVRRGQKYAVIQYALRSTKNPNAGDWLDIWNWAQLIWSYYPIVDWAQEDGGGAYSRLSEYDFRFYHAPLGVDPQVFKPQKVAGHRFIIATIGNDWLTQSVRECVLAAQRVGRNAVYIGPEIQRTGFTQAHNVSDLLLAQNYSHSDYVSGLRRVEGFELPAAEGLLCGARPILFDREHYKHWYGSWAEYIPEAPREDVIESLVKLFSSPVRKVTKAEQKAAREKFSWGKIIKGFWERAL